MLIHRPAIKVLATISILCSALAISEPVKQFPDWAKLPDTRIVGGEDATPGEFPWIVAVFFTDAEGAPREQFCAGSLIDSKWVLTATHCFAQDNDGFAVQKLSVQVNLINVNNPEEGHTSAVKNIFKNKEFNFFEFDGDIALLELSEPAPADIPVLPLADEAVMQASGAPGSMATIMGWGSTSEEGDASQQLLKTEIPLVSTEVCNAEESYNGEVTENMICAGLDEGGKGPCFGDSGGPMLIRHEGEFHQAGIVSWGEGCAVPKKYGVYSRVASLANWINDVQAGLIEGIGRFTLISGSKGFVSGETGSEVTYEIDVSEGSNVLFVDTRDLEDEDVTGDVDLVIKQGAPPAAEDFDFISSNPGSNEYIIVRLPEPGKWFIQLRGVEAYEFVEFSAFTR